MDAMLNALRNPTARDRSILLGQAGASHFGMALSLATGLIYLLVQYDGFVFTWLVLAVLAIQATLLYGPNLLVGLWRTPNIPLSKIMGGTTFLFIYFIAAAAYFPLALIPFFAIGLAGLLYSVSAARPRNFGAGVWIMLLFVGLLYALYKFCIYENQAMFLRL